MTWNNSKIKPLRSQPGTVADYFLCIPVESDIPVVMIYFHNEGYFTLGGGDTQRVRFWSEIEMPFLSSPQPITK